MNMKPKNAKSLLTDNVVLCGMKQGPERVIVWVLAAPSIRAEASTVREAEEMLLEHIWQRYELDEPVGIKYEESADFAQGREGILLKVAPNEVVDAVDPGRYFKKGFCSVCQSGQGCRNDELLRVEHIPRGIKSGVLVRFQPYFKCGMRVGMVVLHKRICREISKRCDPLLEFREVRIKPDRMTDFREVIPKKIVPCVVTSAKKSRAGGVCSKCGTKFIYAETVREHAGLFIDYNRAKMIRSHGAGGIGDESRPSLCVTGTIWQAITKLKHGEGVLASEIRELEDKAINMKPKFEKITAFRP
jgi:hypothetical protein